MSVPGSYTLQIKRVFLNFLQQYFKQIVDARYRWSENPQSTKIIIADKFSIDKPVNEKRPLIILSRQSISPANLSLKQRAFLDFKNNKETFLDLLQGSVVINCMAKSGTVAEDLAHLVLISILSYRDKLKGYNGVHTIERVQVGEETQVIVDASSTLINVPVIIQFTKSIGFTPVPDLTSAGYMTLVYSGVTSYLYEALDYDVYRNRVCLHDPTEHTYETITVTYIDNQSLNTITQVFSGVASGVQCFYLDYNVYGYYPAIHEIRVDAAISGITFYYPQASSISSGEITYSGITNSGITYSGFAYVSGYFSGMI